MTRNGPDTAPPPLTLEERIKRTLVPARAELARITRRELKKGEPELKLLPHLVDPARAAMDIGANRGIWAGRMAGLTQTVWAFEPNPKLFDFLERAAPVNVKPLAIALSDTGGSAELMIPGEAGRYSNQGASLSEAKIGARAHMRVSVEQARLDDLDPPATGFMKIDVEGHERAVLEGAAGLIARDRPVLIVEMEERHTGRDIETDLQAVEDMGYRTLIVKAGRLQTRAFFDPDSDHRERAGQPGYVNNFLFLPV